MNLLLDTHIVLWLMEGSLALNAAARLAIDSADTVYVSSVSLWEASIKVATGKLKVDIDKLEERLRQTAFVPLNVTWQHAVTVRRLPRLHGDPFDRMLIAQAVSEPMHLLTHDSTLSAYSPLVMVV